eukprot:Transcript_8644.p3 GENE.Transcript_8644~~Transcript_8644.p3  ORF type:complete len:135 (+),score=1.96 Transcript_8644:873-1277(+)
MPPHRALPEGSPEIASRRRARAGTTERARADVAAQVLFEFNSVGHALESLSMSWCGYGPLCGGIADYDGDVARLRAVLFEYGARADPAAGGGETAPALGPPLPPPPLQCQSEAASRFASRLRVLCRCCWCDVFC